jgi:hypothetical protein
MLLTHEETQKDAQDGSTFCHVGSLPRRPAAFLRAPATTGAPSTGHNSGFVCFWLASFERFLLFPSYNHGSSRHPRCSPDEFSSLRPRDAFPTGLFHGPFAGTFSQVLGALLPFLGNRWLLHHGLSAKSAGASRRGGVYSKMRTDDERKCAVLLATTTISCALIH